MALAHCILSTFLGVGCHCLHPPLDVPTFSARCLHVQRRERTQAAEGGTLRGREMFWRNVIKQFSRLLIHEPPGGDCRKQYVVMKQPTGTYVYASVGSVGGTFATKSSLDSSTTDSDKHIPNLCVRADNYCFIAYIYITFILLLLQWAGQFCRMHCSLRLTVLPQYYISTVLINLHYV
jgi:hypothetical protein